MKNVKFRLQEELTLIPFDLLFKLLLSCFPIEIVLPKINYCIRCYQMTNKTLPFGMKFMNQIAKPHLFTAQL